MEIPIGNLITATATIVGVVVGSRLAYYTSNRGKIWDLRRQAYGLILSELAAVERLCDRADAFIQEDEHRYFESEEAGHNAEIAKHMTAIRNRFSDDYLALSDAFIARFEEFLSELEADDPNETSPEMHDRFAATVRKSRPVLIAQARSETSIQGDWRRFQSLVTRVVRWTFPV